MTEHYCIIFFTKKKKKQRNESIIYIYTHQNWRNKKKGTNKVDNLIGKWNRIENAKHMHIHVKPLFFAVSLKSKVKLLGSDTVNSLNDWIKSNRISAWIILSITYRLLFFFCNGLWCPHNRLRLMGLFICFFRIVFVCTERTHQLEKWNYVIRRRLKWIWKRKNWLEHPIGASVDMVLRWANITVPATMFIFQM